MEVEFLESKSTIWITDDGQKIKELIPPEFVAFKSTQKKLSNLLIDDYDLSERTAVKSNVDISKPRKTEYMKFIIYPIIYSQHAFKFIVAFRGYLIH